MASGLGCSSGARYLPKEFLPVAGRPGFVHVLEEIAALGPARVVIAYHPYYEAFVTWTRQVLSPTAYGQYLHAAGRPGTGELVPDVQVDFIAQNGPYADLTSLINGADHFSAAAGPQGWARVGVPGVLRQRLPRPEPAARAADVPPGVSVLARPYQRHLAGHRGVITTTASGRHPRMTRLIESPAGAGPTAGNHSWGREPAATRRPHPPHAQLHPLARTQSRAAGGEPKLALTLAAYAQTHTVDVLPVAANVIDLGTPEPVAAG